MEFLSKEFNFETNAFPVNLVLHSKESVAAGFDAVKAGTWARVNLPFDPTEDYHEYRFDFIPGSVNFYAEGVNIATMDGPAVPTSSGHILLSHWSSGNPKWSGGPPEQDVTVAIRYFKAYFNSSDADRQTEWKRRCRDANDPDTLCHVPSVLDDPNAAAHFFTATTPTDEKTGDGNAGSTISRPLGFLSWMAVVWAGYWHSSWMDLYI